MVMVQQVEATGAAAGAFLSHDDDEAALQSNATLPEYDEEDLLEFDPWSFIKGLPPLADCVPAFRKALLPRQTRRYCPVMLLPLISSPLSIQPRMLTRLLIYTRLHQGCHHVHTSSSSPSRSSQPSVVSCNAFAIHVFLPRASLTPSLTA